MPSEMAREALKPGAKGLLTAGMYFKPMIRPNMSKTSENCSRLVRNEEAFMKKAI